MSFGLGDARKRPGIFDSFRAAMTPAELPPDDGKPLSPPKAVLAATAMAIFAGVLFLFSGAYSLLTVDEGLELQVAAYNAQAADCLLPPINGVGDQAVIPPDASEAIIAQGQACQKLLYQKVPQDAIDGARTQIIVVSLVYVVIGIAIATAGWFLRSGAGWSRLLLVGTIALSVIVTMVLQFSNILTLGATLLMVVAVMLCFIGKGAIYFARTKARRAG